MVIIWSVVEAVFVRSLLFIHSFLCIWRTVDVQGNSLFWCLGLGNILHIIELEHRILKKRGQEDKWFCLCFFIHLLNTVPAIWLLEIDRLERSSSSTVNNNTVTTPATNTSDNSQEEALSAIEGITIPVKLDADTWASVLEQGFLFILILGRWMLPRGKLTRDQLSQLLFVYIGSGSDVMELFIIFEEKEIRADKTFSYAILTVWTFSLLQFTLVLTSTKKQRGGNIDGEDPDDDDDWTTSQRAPARCCAKLVEMEIWSLFVAIVLQDGPYLTVRLCAIFVKKVLSYGVIFFALKNCLMIMMLFYRVGVVGTHKKELEEKAKEKERIAEKELEKKISDSRKIKHQNSKENQRDNKMRKYGRGHSGSPPNYWSHPDYFYQSPFGVGRANYGYNAGYY
ncbi:unnamed protein product [Mytilus coruscus]|uniref:Transmembrane protein 26 n=1 Tax=Mytilus coruscus TaxID=42192 RepID=A0A6J8A2T7_MYTCO|nr:unnamed protein product [Mytilus coruscus]